MLNVIDFLYSVWDDFTVEYRLNNAKMLASRRYHVYRKHGTTKNKNMR